MDHIFKSITKNIFLFHDRLQSDMDGGEGHKAFAPDLISSYRNSNLCKKHHSRQISVRLDDKAVTGKKRMRKRDKCCKQS